MRKAWIFIFAVFVLDRLAGVSLGYLYEHTWTGTGAGQLNYGVHKSAELLVLGSSRAQFHIDPAVLERRVGLTAFNAGFNGQDFLYASLLMDLRAQLAVPSPKVVVLHVDPWSFSRRQIELDRLSVFSHFISRSSRLRETVFMRSRLEWIKYLSWSYRYNGKVLTILGHAFRKPNVTFNGFSALGGVVSNEQASTGDDTALGTFEYWPYKEQLLRRLNEDSRAAGSRLFLVHSPTTVDTLESHRRWTAALAGVLAQNPGVEFIDFSVFVRPEFKDRSLFRDRDHLNGRGAQLFSNALADELARRLASKPPG